MCRKREELILISRLFGHMSEIRSTKSVPGVHTIGGESRSASQSLSTRTKSGNRQYKSWLYTHGRNAFTKKRMSSSSHDGAHTPAGSASMPRRAKGSPKSGTTCASRLMMASGTSRTLTHASPSCTSHRSRVHPRAENGHPERGSTGSHSRMRATSLSWYRTIARIYPM